MPGKEQSGAMWNIFVRLFLFRGTAQVTSNIRGRSSKELKKNHTHTRISAPQGLVGTTKGQITKLVEEEACSGARPEAAWTQDASKNPRYPGPQRGELLHASSPTDRSVYVTQLFSGCAQRSFGLSACPNPASLSSLWNL